MRVVAATNKDLSKLVTEDVFREDLWYRLAVIPIKVPPLRERAGDLPLLAQHFVERSNSRFGSHAKLTESGVRALSEYTWPGNVRQFQHTIERLCILSPDGRIDDGAARQAIRAMAPSGDIGETLAGTEAEQIRKVLVACGNNKSRAAKILGIERKTLYRKLERLGIT